MGYTPPSLEVRKATGVTSVYPEGVTTDDIKILANGVDISPYIQISGAAGIAFYVPGTNAFRFDSSTGGMILAISYVTPDVELKFITDKNCFLRTQGTGKVKFGDYTAGAATDSTGYISILDAAGNARKLMVQA